MRGEVSENTGASGVKYARIFGRIIRLLRHTGGTKPWLPPLPALLRFASASSSSTPSLGNCASQAIPIRLRPQAAKILVLLASRPGQLVTREVLREKIWGNETFVDFEHGLNLCIREVRAALDDDADTPRYVETLRKRGYRFIAPVQETNQQQTLGRYRLTGKIGAGGMGEVYQGQDLRLGREVAIKVLPPGALQDENARSRFRREAELLCKLNHANIATVHDFETQDGSDFLVMEYIRGETLSDRLCAGPLPEKDVLRLGLQLADGIAAAHEHGVIHRDLKPGNLRVTPDRSLKIPDFGLARAINPA